MSLIKKIALSAALGLVGLAVTGVIVYQAKNTPAELQEPNYYSYYQNQDAMQKVFFKPDGALYKIQSQSSHVSGKG